MNNFNSLDVSHLEKDSQYERPVHKRRSSVFQSRTIALDEEEGAQLTKSEKLVDTNDGVERVPETLEDEAFSLEEYINGLRNERKEWIETLKQRKAERKSLTKHKLHLESEGQPLDVSILSDSEKAFVIARPDYQHICRSNRRLSETTLKVSLLKRMVYKLNQRFIFQMEKRLHKVTEKVIQTSES